MPPRSSKRKGRAEDGDAPFLDVDSSRGSREPTQKRTRAGTRSSRSRRRRDEYAEDEGRKGSQCVQPLQVASFCNQALFSKLLGFYSRDFLNWCQFQKKNKDDESKRSKAYLRTFETAMDKARQQVDATVEKVHEEMRKVNEGSSKTVHEGWKDDHAEKISGKNGKNNSSHMVKRCKDHPLFTQGRRVLDTVQKIVDSYHEIEQDLAKLSPPSTSFDFESDHTEASQIIRSARQLSEHFSLQTIVPGSVELLETKAAGPADGVPYEMALGVFKRLPASRDGTWGQTAYAHVQAWSDLLKTAADA